MIDDCHAEYFKFGFKRWSYFPKLIIQEIKCRIGIARSEAKAIGKAELGALGVHEEGSMTRFIFYGRVSYAAALTPLMTWKPLKSGNTLRISSP